MKRFIAFAIVILFHISCTTMNNKHASNTKYNYINSKNGPLFEIYKKSKSNNIPVGEYVALDTLTSDTLAKINFENLKFNGDFAVFIPEQGYSYLRKYIKGNVTDTIFRFENNKYENDYGHL